MSRLSFSVRQFIDEEALGSSEEEEDSDEEEDWDEPQVRTNLLSAQPARASAAWDGEDAESAQNLAKFYHEMAIASRREGPSNHPLSDDHGDPTLKKIVNAPHEGDKPMFCVSCKIGWEQDFVFRLIRKSFKDEVNDVTTVFCVPKSPGRLYFEADSPGAVYRLCKDILCIFHRSIFAVPIVERVTLLQTSRVSLPPIQVGNWVRVRNGMYNGDVGPVVSAIDEWGAVVVKLKSRETRPSDYQSDLARSEAGSSRKRKRKGIRVEPYTLEKHPFRPQLVDGSSIQITKDGFKFGGKSYSKDGYRLVELCRDRVEIVSSGISEYETYVDFEATLAKDKASPTRSHFTPTSSAVSIPLFLNAGDRVRVSKGPLVGRTGIIQSLTVDRALVALDGETDSTQADIEVGELARIFELCDLVEVKVGTFAGRIGIVSIVHPKKLTIVDQSNHELIEVAPGFVDSAPSARKASNGVKIGHGMLVLVTAGRYVGREGTVKHMGQWMLTIRETGSEVHFKVAEKNVKCHPNYKKKVRLVELANEEADVEADYAVKLKRREAFKKFAAALGMDLNLYSITCGDENYVPFHIKNFTLSLEEYEPWKNMDSREGRIAMFWEFAKDFSVDQSALLEFATIEKEFVEKNKQKKVEQEIKRQKEMEELGKDKPKRKGEQEKEKPKEEEEIDERPNIPASRLRLLRAFRTATESLFIKVDRDRVFPEEYTEIQEQGVWEYGLMDLMRELGVEIKHVGPRVEPDESPDRPTCHRNHRDEGFENQQVYIWQGFYKGKLGVVKQMNNERCRVQLETTAHDAGVVIINGQCLIATCGCTLGKGAKPTWAKDKHELLALFDRTIGQAPSPLRSRTPPRTSIDLPLYHDESEQGMWLFKPEIAELRKTNHFVIKIESHPDSEVAGRREGNVLADLTPQTLPLLKSIPATVKVQYTVKKKGELPPEMLPVISLGLAKPRVKGRHAVISGNRIGEIVIYVRSDGNNAQVYKEGLRHDVFYIAKSEICPIVAL